jgi:DNA-binding Lrp family transcriptional regulator
MLRRFLETLQTGEVQSLLEIARRMDISPDMVLQMAKELTSKGYLQEFGTDCVEPQKGCPDCPVNSTCQVIVKHWFLTEKGRTAISDTRTSTNTGISVDIR